MKEVAGKVKSEPVDGDYIDDLVPSVKVAKTWFVPDWHTVNNTYLSNDCGGIKEHTDQRLTTTKCVRQRSSKKLRVQRMLQPKKEVQKLGLPVIKGKPLAIFSKLNFRPLQPKKSLIVSEGATSYVQSRMSTGVENPQPNSTASILSQYEPSNNMAPMGTLRLVRDTVPLHKSGEKESVGVLNDPPRKLPISRFKSSMLYTEQIQPLTMPSQLQSVLSPTRNTEQQQALLLSLAGSGQQQGLIPSTDSLQTNKQISFESGTQGNEKGLARTVTKPKPSSKHPVKPQKIGKSSAIGIQRKLKPKTEVPIGKFATSQKEKQSVSPGHIRVMIPTSNSPDPKPAVGNAYGQLSCTAAGNFGPLQVPVSTSSFGQLNAVQIPCATGLSHSNLRGMLPPFQTVLPSVAGGSQMIQFQPVVSPVSSGLLPSGAPVQFRVVVSSGGQFKVVSNATGESLNFTAPQEFSYSVTS